MKAANVFVLTLALASASALARAGEMVGDGQIVFGRAGGPVGVQRQAYVIQNARVLSFDANLQFDEGWGRSGGPAARHLGLLTQPKAKPIEITHDRSRLARALDADWAQAH
ncbi:MAG TPA: hypothetical protein VFB54_06960 [Burkholderiales bacterium]|nr:hypothetical protein [Burkholderiales bacterium]